MGKPNFVDQKLNAIRQLIESRPDVFLQQGSVVASWREYRGKPLGPYFRLAYRDRGRQRSIYLGRSVRLADAVRTFLNEQHQAVSRRRELRRIRVLARVRLRRLRKRWDQQLRQFGLYLHGFEVRGWRGHRPDSRGKNGNH